MSMMYCAGLSEATKNEFFFCSLYFLSRFISFFCGVSFVLYVNRYTSRKSTERKRQIPSKKKRAESTTEKIRICQKLFSFWVWLLEKAGEEKTRHLSSGTNLLGRERRKIMEQKKIEKHGRGKKKRNRIYRWSPLFDDRQWSPRDSLLD